MGDMNVKNAQREQAMYSYRANHSEKEENNGKNAKSVFAGDLGINSDPIAYKKRQAQKEAVKRIVDTIRQEMELDDSVSNMKDNAEKQMEKANASEQKINEMEQLKEQTKEEFGTGAEGEKEYMLWVEDVDKAIAQYRQDRADALESGKRIHEAVVSVGLERLKTHEVADAQKDSDDILETAAKEIAFMMYQEGVDHLDEKMEEILEKAKETEKEEEEKKKLAEKTKQDYEVENTANAVDWNALMEKVRKEVQEMLHNNKLLGEDVKGLEVDSML